MLKTAFFKSLKLAFYIFLIGLPWVLISQYQPQLLNSITNQIHDYGLFFRLTRWSIILSVFFFWPYLVKRTGRHYPASEECITYWLSNRWQIVAWLILFELLICENIVLELFTSFTTLILEKSN